MKKSIKTTIIIIATLVYICFMYFYYDQLRINSDMACMVLEANDMIHGNLFLSDWWLTGTTFLTTDLFYFVLGTIVGGVSKSSFVMAEMLMFVVALLSSVVLLSADSLRVKPRYLCLHLSVVAFPTTMYMFYSTVHMGYVGWGFLAIAFYVFAKNTTENRKFLFFALISSFFLVLAETGDVISVITITAPICLVALIDGIRICAKKENIKAFPKRELIVIALGSASFIFSRIINKVFLFIGGADEKSYLSERHFLSLDDSVQYITKFIRNVLTLMDANIEKQQIIKLTTFLMAFRLLFLIIALVFIFWTVIDYIRNREVDDVALILSIGLIMISITCLISEENEARYYSYFPLAASVVFCRSLSCRWQRFRASRIVTFIIAGLMFCTLIPNLITFSKYDKEQTNDHIEVEKVLDDYGLTNGYGSFWNASVISVISNNSITVRAISISPIQTPYEKQWFAKGSWYSQPANFVLIGPDGYEGVTEENVIICFGQPQEVVSVNEYRIYIYDYDITNKLNYGVYDDE